MSVDILADEGVNFRIIRRLRESGLVVKSVAEEYPGARDREVLAHSVRHGSLLLTEDRDFGALVFAHKHTSIGVLLVRYTKAEEESLVNALVRVVKTRGDQLLGSFTVVTAQRVRIRPLP